MQPEFKKLPPVARMMVLRHVRYKTSKRVIPRIYLLKQCVIQKKVWPNIEEYMVL